MISCPILSQQKRSDDGRFTWEHHPCIEEFCTFWSAEAKDCAIRASGLAILRRENAGIAGADQSPDTASATPAAPAFDPATLLEAPMARLDGIEKRLEELPGKSAAALLEVPMARLAEIEAKLEALAEKIAAPAPAAPPIDPATLLEAPMARLGDIEKKVDELVGRNAGELLEAPLARLGEIEKKLSDLSEKSAAASRDLALKLLEGVSALEQPVNALRQDLGAIQSKIDETAGVLSRALAVMDEQSRREETRLVAERAAEAKECNARGLAFFHQRKHEAAEAAFRRAIELEPGLAEAHSNLGIVLGRMGRSDEATACLEKALEIRPDFAVALNNLGFLCHEGMQFEKAIDLFRRATMEGKDSSVSWTNLGNACYKLDRRAEAVDAWRKALERDPLNETAARALRMFEGAEAGS